jgi:hypothetical protein
MNGAPVCAARTPLAGAGSSASGAKTVLVDWPYRHADDHTPWLVDARSALSGAHGQLVSRRRKLAVAA